jgi:CheY-like chemotaxis protein
LDWKSGIWTAWISTFPDLLPHAGVQGREAAEWHSICCFSAYPSGVSMRAESAKILVVDDSRFLRAAHVQILRQTGYCVISAEDGEEALILARSEKPEVIVLDLLLPKLGGVDVIRALKRDPVLKKIPVIVLSGLTRHNETKLLQEGVAACVEKAALDLELLPRIVRDVLRQSATPGDRAVSTIPGNNDLPA